MVVDGGGLVLVGEGLDSWGAAVGQQQVLAGLDVLRPFEAPFVRRPEGVVEGGHVVTPATRTP